MKIKMRALIPTLCLFISTLAFAHDGGGGGGGHGGGGGYHGGGGGYHGGSVGGGYHNNNVYSNNGYHHGYNNNVWYGGGGTIVNVNPGADDAWYDDGLTDDNSTNVVMGVPDGGYYDPSCQTSQTCNPDGECITQQNCN